MRADNLFRKRGGGGFKFIDWQTYVCARVAKQCLDGETLIERQSVILCY